MVYVNKKVEFCSGSVRCQVYEMWAQGGKVACGVVTDDTKVSLLLQTDVLHSCIAVTFGGIKGCLL